MPLIEIILVLIVVGVLLWLVNSYIPMAGPIKSLLNAVVVIVMVIWGPQSFWTLAVRHAHSRGVGFRRRVLGPGRGNAGE